MRLKKTWSDLKNFALKKGSNIQYIERKKEYEVWIVEQGVFYYSIIPKKIEGTYIDQSDFENNYKINANVQLASIIQEVNADGSFRSKGFSFTAIANTTTSLDIQFPYEVRILSSFFHCKNSNDGDMIEAKIAPDTITGVITDAAPITQDWIKVSQTVVDNAKVGYEFNLNGDIYDVVSIDRTNLQITLDRNLDNAVAVNDYVKQNVRMIETFYVFGGEWYNIGESKLGASILPANTIMRIYYQNTGLSDLEFQFDIELLY